VPKRACGASGATGYRKRRRRAVGVSHRRRWPTTVRFFNVLNTPIGALSVLLVVVAVDVFLYFGYSPKTPTPLPAARTVPSATTTIERTERAGPKERTQPERTRPESTRPATTLQSTTPTATPTATPTERSATVSATSSPSP
jgi:hypothetical protein